MSLEIYCNSTIVLKWGDSYDGHGEMYYDYNHGPSYKHHDSYHEPVYKADDKPVVYKPEPSYKPEPTYNWLAPTVIRFITKHCFK